MMPLSAPPDYTKSVYVLAIGFVCGVCLFMLTRNNLPHVGDNIHSLPHGGCYRDGTKAINYGGPRKTFPSSGLLSGFGVPALGIVLLIIALIHVSEFAFSRSHRHTCVHRTFVN
nr:MAG: TGB2 protein [Dracophyllum betaflexi-like virus]